MSAAHAEVPYSGELRLVHDFYSALGVEVTELGVRFSSIEFVYTDGDLAIDGQLLSIEIDRDLSEVEEIFNDIGVAVLNSGFDISGPFLVAVDPAGQKVRVSLSSAALAKLVRKKSDQSDAS